MAGILACAAIAAAGQTRRALVVGVTDYKNVPAAPQSSRNAIAMGRALTARNFQVALAMNVEAEELARVIAKFLQDLQPGDVGAFYFSGYAVQDGGENYLLPSSYSPAAADGIEFQSYSLKRLVRYLESKKLATGLIVVDASPVSPPIEKAFPEPGLASLDIRSANLVLALANLPGRAVPPAPDRELGRLTEAWVDAAKQSGIPLDAALRRIKQQVSLATNGEQVPAEISTLINEFSFQPRSAASIEWERISAAREPGPLEDFRRRYPDDPLAAEAGRKLRDMEWERISANPDEPTVRQFVGRHPNYQAALQWLARHQAAQQAAQQTELQQKAKEEKAKEDTSAGILAAIARYAKAYENKDVDELQALRPGLGRPERKRLEDAFREFKSIQYSLTPTASPVVMAGAANVSCKLKVQMRGSGKNGPEPVEQAVTVKLRRQGESWVIDSIQ